MVPIKKILMCFPLALTLVLLMAALGLVIATAVDNYKASLDKLHLPVYRNRYPLTVKEGLRMSQEAKIWNDLTIMEGSDDDASKDKSRYMVKAKSCIDGPIWKACCCDGWKSTDNEAVKTLDQALVRLKKSKFVSERSTMRCPSRCCGASSMEFFMDSMSCSCATCPSHNTESLMSVNFSHYDLQRNLSMMGCDSDDRFSDATGASSSLPDKSLKEEHLERYFRSAEMWRKRSRDNNPATTRFLDIPEK